MRILEAIKEQKLKGPLKLNDFDNLLDIEMLLALGSRVALSAGPPLGWNANSPLYAHRPPFPTEDLMRCSTLFRVMNTLDHKVHNQINLKIKFLLVKMMQNKFFRTRSN